MSNEKDWITIKGAHVPVGENGELEGRTGKKITESSGNTPKSKSGRSRNTPPVAHLKGNELGIREGESLKSAAFRYYDHLRNNPANREGFGEVRFTRIGRNKLESTSLSDTGRFKLLPAIKPLIEKGDYLGRRQLDNPRSNGIVAFHYFEGNVKIGNDVVFIGTTVAEDMNGNKFYNLNKDPDVLEAKKKALDTSKKSAWDSGAFQEPCSLNIDILPDRQIVNPASLRAHPMAFDRAPSMRSEDGNGFLHVARSHITKATVNPYRGCEIPGWREAGLEPDAIYYGFRAPEELEKSVPTWAGLPVHIEHHLDRADDPSRMTRVGAVGTGVTWRAPYIDAPLTIWDGAVIDAINDGSFRQLSCAYFYDPDFTPGTHEGVDYDFVMRNIRGNHVALVEKGRAGADVLVADAALAAADDEVWRTAKNGKKYRVDEESGEITAGNIGQSEGKGSATTRDVTITGNELGTWSDIKELRKKAVSYYREHLQGKPAHRDDLGEIRFSRKGRDETAYFSANPDKLLMVPALRDIIETGKAGEEEKADHGQRGAQNQPRKDGIVAFIPITKTVNFKGQPKEVETLVGRDARGHLYYDLFLDGKREEGKKKSPASYPEPKSGVAGDSSAEAASALELNIRILPLEVKEEVSQPAQDSAKHTFARRVAMGIKKWLSGATEGGRKAVPVARKGFTGIDSRAGFDANPDIEKAEVELAQTIIDLHKTNPETGEIVDITEDEDKARRVREIVGALAGKLEPEELKTLTEAIQGLAYTQAGDGDLDEGEAADDAPGNASFAGGAMEGDGPAGGAQRLPRQSQATASGAQEARPSDIRSEGMRKAMQDCGIDAENEIESRAFAEGVKYGESLERNPDERKKLDREHESEGAKKAMDSGKGAEIARILDGAPGLAPDVRARLEKALAPLAADEKPCGRDEDPAPAKPANPAMDSARMLTHMQGHMRSLNEAARNVRPLVGDVDPIAFDSAASIYGYALEACGIKARQYPRTAWQGMVDIMRSQKALGANPAHAADSALTKTKYDGPFKGLNNITLG